MPMVRLDIWSALGPILDRFLNRQPGRLVGTGDQAEVLGEDAVHHLAVRELHGRGREHVAQRHQHPGREHRRQRRPQGGLSSLQ